MERVQVHSLKVRKILIVLKEVIYLQYLVVSFEFSKKQMPYKKKIRQLQLHNLTTINRITLIELPPKELKIICAEHPHDNNKLAYEKKIKSYLH